MVETGLSLVPLLALVGAVIIMASLFSGVVERTGFPQVALFLLLGLVLGPQALGIIDLPLESHTLEVIATLALLLVLFTDAVSLDIGAMRRHFRTAAIVVGPGTLLAAVLNTVAAHLLLKWSWPHSAIVGAALASTDPVLLRSLLRHPRLPRSVRSALRIEAGSNDAVLLPIVVIAGAALVDATGPEISRRLVGLFLLGPALGAAVGAIAISVMVRVRKRFSVRRDYESLYALGVALVAFTVAESVGGSGFLAAFAAGLVIALMDVELCDCFHDYGEATAEMMLLLTFVAFGTSLIWTGIEVVHWRTLVFVIVTLVTRTAVLLPALAGTSLTRSERHLIAWLGPRGLSSLLLVMLAVIARVPGAEQLFAVTSLGVLISIVAHGGGILWLTQRTLGESAPPDLVVGEKVEGVTVAQLEQWRSDNTPHVLVDARAERSWEADRRIAEGAVRMDPDQPVRSARELGLSQHGTVVVYCA
jgi:sodium/hydrogen antiporter